VVNLSPFRLFLSIENCVLAKNLLKTIVYQ